MYKQYYIYFMMSDNRNALYIGVTDNLERRVKEYQSGTIPGFTRKYCCTNLVYYETYSDVDEAIAREKKLKKWSRAKKETLIQTTNPHYEDLSLSFRINNK